ELTAPMGRLGSRLTFYTGHSAPSASTVPSRTGCGALLTRSKHMAENEGAWLTQEAYDKLKAELEHLSGPYRQEIIDRISAARDEGGLQDNGGYHAGREEQGKSGGRIKQLQHLLEAAQVSDKPAADDGVVEPGMVVEASIAGKTMTFLLGSREVADTLV